MHVSTAGFLTSLIVGTSGAVLALFARTLETAVFLPLLGLGILVLLAAALRCASWPDVFFHFAVLGFVWWPLCFIAVFPDVFSYVDGLHRHTLISADSVLRGLQSCALVVFGWTIGRFALAAPGFRSLALPQAVPAHQSTTLLAWFAFSIAVQAVLAISTGFGVATVEAKSNFSGYFYYFMPADALALAVSGMVGGGMLQRRLAMVAIGVLASYWLMKLFQGWKGAFVQTLIIIALFASVRAGWVVRVRLVGIAVLVVLAYFVVLKPVVNIVRISNATGADWSEAAEGYAGLRELFSGTSIVQTRLTEGTVNSLLAHDAPSNWETMTGGAPKMLRDVVEGIVPGDLFGERNLARIFTEDVLGQPPGVDSTFATGILGTAYAINPIWGGFALGMMLAAALSGLALIERMSSYTPLSVFVAGAGALFCVEAVSEGGTGRIEQILIWSLVLGLVLIAVEHLRSYLQRLGASGGGLQNE